ncbi:MFS transporter [Nonomuraea sp. NPDC050663]|uniref:MFS transporter n=1 Tax=Nonomuraea sp. NPDC050663 TaxID=3364370 RepID=UPI00378A2EBD
MENAIKDWRGRTYLLGPVPADRRRMFWLAWAAMAAVGPLQYGYAALLAGATLAPLVVWVLCQAATALPALRLVRRGAVSVRAALAAGSVASGLGLATLAFSSADLVVLAGYGVLGGAGGGLVYAVCTEVVSSWYPDRPATRVGLVTGAFGYGAAPLVLWASLDPAASAAAFTASALLALVVIAAAARFLRLPPASWWPQNVDPRARALDKVILRRTPSAARQFSLAQALRSATLAKLVLILVCAGAVSLFDVIVVAGSGSWGALVLLITLNGGGRAVAMRVSERFGRRRVLGAVLACLALGQPLLGAGMAGQEAGGPALWLGTILAGLGGGAFYPLVARQAHDYFGSDRHLHATVYSTKALAGLAAAVLVTGATLPAAGALAAVALLACVRLRAPRLPATIPV